ncbi:hypothetical protein DMB44_03425 [Thermoplasma sp. Kam2015]|uniref:hypothetical protein n=1 Tax=Thermoplasma sp. Kam2015 TaxID=2094122 RepID=UPI000D8709CD|nr:hypothetical protein [Thermoplasma sp. Kam2015]PYB68404.1 hypothetical protein DMB44_03425 [Thermoplasma sp. Kam2015]
MNAQAVVIASTILIFILSAILSIFLTLNYVRNHRRSSLFWSIGMWLFAFSVLLETVFAYGIFNQSLIKIYLFAVAELVLFLSFGSANISGGKWLSYYYVYSMIVSIYLIISLILFPVERIVLNYVVFGPLPLNDTIASSLITFPAAVVIIAVAVLSYRRKRDFRLFSIILGVVIVSIAGTLYIAKFPAFLYYAEFIGIVLLWIGFFDRNAVFSRTSVKA